MVVLFSVRTHTHTHMDVPFLAANVLLEEEKKSRKSAPHTRTHAHTQICILFTHITLFFYYTLLYS